MASGGRGCGLGPRNVGGWGLTVPEDSLLPVVGSFSLSRQ